MADAPVQNPKPKKKWGFLGTLWRLFLVVVVFCGIVTAIVYFQRKQVTALALEMYCNRLAVVLVANYQILADEEFRKESQAKEGDHTFSAEEFKAKILTEKKEKFLAATRELHEAYLTSASEGWYITFQELDAQIKKIFQDKTVSPQEYQELLQHIAATTKKYQPSLPIDPPK